MPSLYLHIPFCEKKCVYCDFYSIETISPMEEFLKALHNEIDMYGKYGKDVTFDTVFFGGGTPSLLTPLQLESILQHLTSTYAVTDDAEITLETNPGTVTKEKLVAYRSIGINRISLGVQSFHEDELRFLSRIHSSDEARECIQTVREVGFDNFSIDLIYALPGQGAERWLNNLEQAMKLKPPHISAYGLIVEDGTPLARMVLSKQVSPAPADDEAGMYEITMDFLAKHGYEHYEVSNYAKPGFRSKHNYNYWTHGGYLGFGPSAHSFWNDTLTGNTPRRWWNIANLSHYCEKLHCNELPLVSSEQLSLDELFTERILLGLRSDGIDLKRLRTDFGKRMFDTESDTIRQLVRDRLVTVENESLRLTSRGYLLCDEVCMKLIG